MTNLTGRLVREGGGGCGKARPHAHAFACVRNLFFLGRGEKGEEWGREREAAMGKERAGVSEVARLERRSCRPAPSDAPAPRLPDPCCVMDVVEGHLVWEQGKTCVATDECVVCNDITECPHCFIGASLLVWVRSRGQEQVRVWSKRVRGSGGGAA